MFGRIAAQAAKQNIVQRVRDAEREIIYNEFKGREGQLVNGIVQRFEKRNIIVNLGRTDAILPEKEQVPRERYRQGDRIRAYIVSVEITSRGPQIVLSRTHPGMLTKLLSRKFRKSMKVSSKSKARRVSPEAGRKSPSCPMIPTSILWGPASA